MSERCIRTKFQSFELCQLACFQSCYGKKCFVDIVAMENTLYIFHLSRNRLWRVLLLWQVFYKFTLSCVCTHYYILLQDNSSYTTATWTESDWKLHYHVNLAVMFQVTRWLMDIIRVKFCWELSSLFCNESYKKITFQT